MFKSHWNQRFFFDLSHFLSWISKSRAFRGFRSSTVNYFPLGIGYSILNVLFERLTLK